MKNSNDTIGNRTRDLPTCSAVPQPTAPPRAPCNGSTDVKSIGCKMEASVHTEWNINYLPRIRNRIISMKNSSDTIGNRAPDLPAFSAMPQPTAPPCAPNNLYLLKNENSFKV